MKVFIYLKFIFLLSFAIAVQAWDTTTIDVGVNFGNISQRSIALDSSGNIHGVYGGRQLYHKKAHNSEVVDTTLGSGKYPSIAIDSGDTLHIVYATDSNLLKCAIGTFNNYQIYTVDTGVSAGEQHYSVDVNSSGVTHIVYIKSHTLKHAWYDGVWHNETLVSSGVQATTSLAIDSNDNIHISYAISGELKYIAKIGSTWVHGDIDTSGYSDVFSSIAVASNNDVYVAYLDTNANELKIAKKSGTTWSSVSLRSALDTTGWAPSLSIEGTTCYISFRESDTTHKYIKYVVYDGSSTSTHDVAEISLYGLSSIAVLNGTVYVLYNSDATTIKRNGYNFAKASDVGYYSAVASDSNGYLHVSYTDTLSQTLRYATNYPSGSWSFQTINGTLDVQETAIAVDSNMNSHICFYDRSSRDLKYASNSSGSWNIETVDSSGDIGGSDGVCDIDVNSSNGVHISYYDASNTQLKYARKGSGTWIVMAVPSTGSSSKYNSIAIKNNDTMVVVYAKDYINIATDSNNVNHKSYFESGKLHYSSSLEDYNLTINADHSTIALDSTQNAYISFYDKDTHDAKLLSNATGRWQVESVATSGDVGQYASIALSSDNQINVCYHNADIDALQCSYRSIDRITNALTSFYYATNGEHWLDSTNWLSGDICSWYGVSCDANNNISSIDMIDNNLSGALPKEIGDLNATLSRIIIKGNNIDDISALKTVTSLRGIDIRNNNISDISALSNLTNLMTIYLSYNPIGSLEAIKNLHPIYLYADSINLTALPNFSDMSLNILSLSGNRLSNLSGIEGVSSIYELYLSVNELTDISALTSIDSLLKVDFLFNRHLSDISPLSNSVNLFSLSVAQTAVSDLSVVANFPDLRLLHAGKLVKVSDLTPLTNLTKMSELSLWLDGNVTDISALSNMSQMNKLSLHGGVLKDLSPLLCMSAIESLTLHLSNIKDISLLKNLTTLKNLDIESNSIRDISALSNLTHLNSVYISGNCIRDFSPVSGVGFVDGNSADEQKDPGKCMVFMPTIIMYLLN